MKILYGYRDIKDKLRDPVMAIGIFDGVHLGHKRVIKRVLSNRGKDRDKVVMTFDPHPRTVLVLGKKLPRIMSLDHRLSILDKMGLDAVIVVNFTDFIAMMPPEEFIRKVILTVGARKIYVGENFHFGRGKSGDVETFAGLGKKYGIDVRIVKPVKKGRRVVSSTWLRKLICAGQINKASKLLRRPVSVLGTVVGGDKRGHSLGFPTANIDPHHEVIPPPGVYAVKANVDGRVYDGVLNIGFKPTFYGRDKKRRKEPEIEAHLLDFEGDLYGLDVEIFFIKRIRCEKKYKNVGQFRRQVMRDIDHAGKYLSDKKHLKMICWGKQFAEGKLRSIRD